MQPATCHRAPPPSIARHAVMTRGVEFHSLMHLAIVLVLSLSTTVSSSYSTEFPGTVCEPCALLHPYQIVWLSASRPPCYHPGQPILDWPVQANCSKASKIHSQQISVDEDGVVFAKERICLYYSYEVIKYSFLCEGVRQQSSFRIGHSVFSKKRRFKRWLRRRNPDSDSIHFQQERYVKELPENTSVSSLVVSVRAAHAADQPIYYSMVAPQDSRSQNIFTLNTVTGDITLAKALDREVLDKHVLKVTAYERVDPTVSSSTTVIVDVLDVQDNSPVFERDSYFADIREDAPIGTTVLSVFARDLDVGQNGMVEYSLGEGNGAQYLSIHSRSGVVQTAAPLDRETLSLIRLDVVASDCGEPRRQSSALVEIGIIDVNDNAPLFDKDFYNVSISENATIPMVVATVKATDKDSGVNGHVHYSIVSTSSVPLTIDYSTGEVTLREAVDAKHSPLTVLVRAKDGAQPSLTSTVSFTLHIEDINDHAPRFIASQKQIFLEENIAVGEEVGKVYAIDDDSGLNGQVRYSIEGSEDFSIDPDSGVIQSTRLLDRERTAVYELEIIASDLGSPSQNSSTTTTVVVKDVNDNAPEFDKSEYNLTLPEDTERGTQIITLRAHDKDEDQKVTYRIEKISKDVIALIDMGEQGALLSLSGKLHSSDHLIHVEVSATDQGGLQSRCSVNILVDDINSAPYFNEHPFSVHIAEDAPVGFPVVIMKAEDSDRGVNAHVRYWMDSDSFEIDAKSGQIRTSEELDREERASYTILIGASDGASPPMNTTTQIEIIIEDVNDNAPKFSSDQYEASIPENIAVGTSFMQVSAIDLDSGNNGIVDYYLNDSDPTVALDLFRLDRTSGTLRVNSQLDRETYANLLLPIFARDRGTPSLSSSSTISISLTDINDNAPRFDQSSYDLYIAENSPSGSIVGTIRAEDPDEGENAEMEFRIFGGTDAKLFDIELVGSQPGVVRILTRTEFDYEAKTNKFYLEVQASSGQLSTTVAVRVHVSDVNDNRPILNDFIVLVNRLDDESTANTIGAIPVFDPDQNATLEYFLEQNDIISADKYTGKLTMHQKLKRNIDATFKTCVSDGPNTVCSTCRFVHVHVDSGWLREAVSVSIYGISLDDFWDPAMFNRLQQSLATLSSWDPASIHVLGAQKTTTGVDVNIVILDRGAVVRAWRVEEIIKSDVKRLEKLSLMRVTVVQDESCAKEPCPYYQKCRQTLKYIHSQEFHQTDNFLARTLKTLKTFVCECPDGFTSSIDLPGQCDLRLDQCYSNPCKNNATCIPLENRAQCLCQGPWTGALCDVPTTALTCIPGYCMSNSGCELSGGQMRCTHCKYRTEDTDERCRLRSLRFAGNGMVHVNREPSRLEWKLQLSISTTAHEGVVLFSGDAASDHLELSIQDRVLKAQFSLGGKAKTIRMEAEPANRVNNGRWHTVTLQYYDRKLTLILDDCDPFVSLHALGEVPCAAQTKIELPAKCLDATVPCFRFLDLSTGMFLGGRPGKHQPVENAFNGCISNLTLDGDLIHFSSSDDLDKVGTVEEGCSPLKDYCSESPCASNAKCVNRWDGFNCRCPHTVHQNGMCKNDNVHVTSRPISFADDESFVVFETDDVIAPFTLSFEFRTSRVDTQIMVAEFDQRNVFYRLEIEDGILHAVLGQTTVVIPCPEFAAGHWTRVEVEFDEDQVVTTIDGLYSVSIKSVLVDLTLSSIYSGLAPSTGHPSRFEGCLREILLNGIPQNVKQKGKIRAGCIVGNRCSVEGVCPRDSHCHRHWDRHKCVCHKGFVGDTCRSACSLAGICGADGFCQTNNSTRGYECQCQNGLSGVNCQQTAPQRMCPPGWWGQFPRCTRCDCAEGRGFQKQCDSHNGQCVCQKFHFLSNRRCVPCDCGLGSSSLECAPSGQCKCNGPAIGRQCDRCSKAHHVLEPKSLKCVKLRDRCPSQMEHGIQWPTTLKGSVARASCKGSESGLATRRCTASSEWEAVNKWNCTRPEYAIMVNKFDALDSFQLLSMLNNATHNDDIITGRNFEISRSASLRIVENELSLKSAERVHLRDLWFTKTLVLSFAKILASESPAEYLNLARKLAEYGRAVFEVHQHVPFLEPFALTSENILFSVDRVDFSRAFPKFNNFLDERSEDFPEVKIEVDGVDKIFYSILPYPRCIRCASPVVTVFANTTLPIRVTYSLTENNGWRYPECVTLQGSVHSMWSSKRASLVGLNLTHVVCEYSSPGTYTMIVKADKGAYLRLSHSDNVASPVMAAIALLLCVLSLISTLVRKGIKTQLIRMGFIVFFALNAANIYFIHKISINQVFCPVRNALLSFTSSTPFAWLFLYSLHLYRMLADGNPRSSTTVCLLLGLVLPCLLSCVSFLFAAKCTILPSGWLFWLLCLPIVMFLLLSFYASATSFLVSLNKQYDVVAVKFSLRKALFQHFILSALTLFYTGIGLFLPLFAISTPLQELVCNITLVVVCLYILVWSFCPAGSSSGPDDLWLEPQKNGMMESTAGPDLHSPLLGREGKDDYDGGVADWMPDVIPADPFLTSTPRPSREYRDERGSRERVENNLAHNILSPADKILSEGTGHLYGNGVDFPLSNLWTERFTSSLW